MRFANPEMPSGYYATTAIDYCTVLLVVPSLVVPPRVPHITTTTITTTIATTCMVHRLFASNTDLMLVILDSK
jgi:hypothetical protein